MTYTMLQIDALREMGNIGSGNAATTLSTLVNTAVDLEITEVELTSLNDCLKKIGISADESTSIVHPLGGEFDGFFWFMIPNSDQRTISNLLTQGMCDDDPSVVSEVANILAGNYIRVLSDMLQMPIDLLPPVNQHLDAYLSEHAMLNPSDRIIFIQNQLKANDQTINCYISMVLSKDSSSKLLKQLGL